MTDKRIVDLPGQATPLGTDEFEIVDTVDPTDSPSGTSKRTSLDQIKDYVNNNLLPNDPNRVLINDDSGNITTSGFLNYTIASEQLNASSIVTASLVATGSSRVFPLQNTVNANRYVNANDLGVILSAGTPGHTLDIPPFGTLNNFASFYVAQFTADALTVSTTAPTTLNGVPGGSFTTPGIGTLTLFINNGVGGGTDDWFYYVISEAGSVPTYQEVYNNDPTPTTNLVAGKPYNFESTTEGARSMPSMTEAQEVAIAAPYEGRHVWTTDTSREIHRRNGGATIDKVAYLSDIAAIEESSIWGEAYFNGNATETVILAQSTPVKIAGTYVPGELSGFTHNAGRLTYAENVDRTMSVSLDTTSSFDGASGKISVSIAKNGVVLPKSTVQIDLDGASPSFKAVTRTILVQMQLNDYLEAFIQNDTGTENITVQSLSLIPHTMGGASTGQNTDLQQAYDNGNGIIVMTDNKPLQTVAATVGQKRGEIPVSMPVADFGAIPSKVLGETAFTTDNLAGIKRYVVYDGVTSQALAYYSDIPGESGDTDRMIFFSSNLYVESTYRSGFSYKNGNAVTFVQSIEANIGGFFPWVEYEVPFISAFSNPADQEEVYADVQLTPLNTSKDRDRSYLISAVPIAGTNRIRFSFHMESTNAYPDNYVFRFHVVYVATPISP